MIMGVATFLIGLLPSYQSIGVAAPILLISIRLVQGIAVGGEWGGATTMVIEYAPTGRRGLYGTVCTTGERHWHIGICRRIYCCVFAKTG